LILKVRVIFRWCFFEAAEQFIAFSDFSQSRHQGIEDQLFELFCDAVDLLLVNELFVWIWTTHRCHIIEANGESYRLRQARVKQKLPPLPI